MRHTVLFIVMCFTAALSGCGATKNASTETTISGDKRAAIRPVSLVRISNSECSNRMGDASTEIRKNWANLMSVPIASAPKVFCNRINNALDAGKLTDGDYRLVFFSGYLTPEAMKALRGG
ncbi:hypothetical protein AB4Y96_24460 [Phyllobacterium sp. TAF24]|uniref:hypothetical protein n=1 Tax=Phyllobacterium sp. TAF24 TaxID=3233068 RepID=UPI003F977CAE